MRRAQGLVSAVFILAAGAIHSASAFYTAQTHPFPIQTKAVTPVEKGFDMLYELKFEEARSQFNVWRTMHPDDPLGDVSVAASYLFEEFYRQHVLTSEFFLNIDRLLGGIEGKPDEVRKTRFEEANQRARSLALRRLAPNPGDADALFALTLVTGMQADFTGILEKHPLQSLSLTKEAEGYAKRLLTVRPDAADAWLALGAANYIIGSLPAYKRFFLWFARFHGDKRVGMEQLRIAAEQGHYLKPYAKIFLALAAMREDQEDVARMEFTDLAAQFPGNPLFAEELSRLNRRANGSRNLEETK